VAEKASAVERALKAQQDLEELREAAIDELLASRAAVDDNLKTLGYSEGGKPKAKHRVGAKHCRSAIWTVMTAAPTGTKARTKNLLPKMRLKLPQNKRGREAN
jgi:hypothetical protein